VRAFAEQWTSLKIEDVIRVDKRRAFNMVRALLGHPPRKVSSDANRGGILDTRPLEALLTARIDFGRITDQIRSGRLQAASVTATHVATGRTTVFFQRGVRAPLLQPWGRTSAVPVTLGAEHVLASGAIPFLFPAVRIKGETYCDGSLRQHVPLSPARRLGAEAIVAINPRALPVDDGAASGRTRQKLFPGPLFLLGKTLNALTLDRVDGDIEQLQLINRLLAAGERCFGSTFVRRLNEELAQEGNAPINSVPLLQVQASEDIGRMSAEYVRSRQFRSRHDSFIENRFTRMARGDTANEADLLSYLLFDGGFARQLIDLGRRDAHRKHDEIVGFFGAQIERQTSREAA
jgi:NTE family protein